MLTLKRILLLITLKIAELSGVIFIPYFLGKLAQELIFPKEIVGYTTIWITGLVLILMVSLILVGVFVVIDNNWKYVKRKIK